MSINLVCMTSNGGLPVFSRKRGDCDNLPFSTVGSLNGLHMFGKSVEADLRTTHCKDGIVVWREFENSITMIAIASTMTEDLLVPVLEYIFSSMILFVGLAELKDMRNLDRLKRDLMPCYPIVDRLLEAVDSELIALSECIVCTENEVLQGRLTEFSEQFGSPYCCLFVRHKIAVATEGWWSLHVIDRRLISLLLDGPQKDVPIYLPKKSPNLAYRLINIQLLHGVNLCLLCGAEPPYAQAETLAQQVWRPDFELLSRAEQCHPRNFPANLQLDTSILGILLINRLAEKCVVSRNIQKSSSGKRATTGSHRLDILRTFYHQAVNVLGDKFFGNTTGTGTAISSESYWSSDYHKCHALNAGHNLICVLYVASIPTHTMRLITQRTMELILSEIYW